jgi:catechol 2,3-dioxygenase-like lactoylglutathione lyase family enzyme
MLMAIHHVQIGVSVEYERETIEFYRDKLGLKEIDKPENLKKNGGAWFQLGEQEFHVAPEVVPLEFSSKSKRHVCFLVKDLIQAEEYFKSRGIEIIPDNQPIPGWKRFYFRDPAGNRMECAELVPN